MLSIGKDDGNRAIRVKGKIKVCRVEYETKDRTNWKAAILAYDMQSAIDYIRKNVHGFDKYISTSIVAEIDAIENEVFDDFFVSKTSVVETTVKQDKPEKVAVFADAKIVEVTDDSGDKAVLCPWCQKEFKNTSTLGTHIKRFHIDI